jgi:hypothetical protein
MSISEPGGAIGVELKKNSPSQAAHAESKGFWRHGRTIFVLRSHCSSNLHHNPIGKLGGREASIDLKRDL